VKVQWWFVEYVINVLGEESSAYSINLDPHHEAATTTTTAGKGIQSEPKEEHFGFG
jgi:hypothetical protein